MPDTKPPTEEEITQSWRELTALVQRDPYAAGSAVEEIPHARRLEVLERTRAFRETDLGKKTAR